MKRLVLKLSLVIMLSCIVVPFIHSSNVYADYDAGNSEQSSTFRGNISHIDTLCKAGLDDARNTAIGQGKNLGDHAVQHGIVYASGGFGTLVWMSKVGDPTNQNIHIPYGTDQVKIQINAVTFVCATFTNPASYSIAYTTGEGGNINLERVGDGNTPPTQSQVSDTNFFHTNDAVNSRNPPTGDDPNGDYLFESMTRIDNVVPSRGTVNNSVPKNAIMYASREAGRYWYNEHTDYNDPSGSNHTTAFTFTYHLAAGDSTTPGQVNVNFAGTATRAWLIGNPTNDPKYQGGGSYILCGGHTSSDWQTGADYYENYGSNHPKVTAASLNGCSQSSFGAELNLTVDGAPPPPPSTTVTDNYWNLEVDSTVNNASPFPGDVVNFHHRITVQGQINRQFCGFLSGQSSDNNASSAPLNDPPNGGCGPAGNGTTYNSTSKVEPDGYYVERSVNFTVPNVPAGTIICQNMNAAPSAGYWEVTQTGNNKTTQSYLTDTSYQTDSACLTVQKRPEPPMGYLDSPGGANKIAACNGNISGWGIDFDSPYTSLDVQVTIHLPQAGGAGNAIFNIKADQYRPDIQPGSHGFSMAIPKNYYGNNLLNGDDMPVTVVVYGVDASGNDDHNGDLTYTGTIEGCSHFTVTGGGGASLDNDEKPTSYTSGGSVTYTLDQTDGGPAPDFSPSLPMDCAVNTSGSRIAPQSVTCVDGPNNNFPPGTTSVTGPGGASATPTQAGDQYCAFVSTQYSGGYIQRDGTIVAGTGQGPFLSTPPGCDVVVNKPTFKVLGSSVHSGGGFKADIAGGSCSGAGQLAGWFNNGSTTVSPYGSSVQLAAIANVAITGVASAQGELSKSAQRGLLDTTFANTSSNGTADTAGNSIDSPALGGAYDSNNGHCLYAPIEPTVFDTPQYGTLADTLINSNNYTSKNSYTYRYSGPQTVNTTYPLVFNNSITVYVTGNVYIGNNISYGAGYSSGNTPSFTVVSLGGNIYIDPAVKSLSGLYEAESVNGVGGTIYTCGQTDGSNNFSPVSDVSPGNDVYHKCSNQLTVHGSFIAKKVDLMRTYGSLRDEAPIGADAPIGWSYNTAIHGASPTPASPKPNDHDQDDVPGNSNDNNFYYDAQDGKGIQTCTPIIEPSEADGAYNADAGHAAYPATNGVVDPSHANYPGQNNTFYDNAICLPGMSPSLQLAYTHGGRSGPLVDNLTGQTLSNCIPLDPFFEYTNSPSPDGFYQAYGWYDNELCSNQPLQPLVYGGHINTNPANTTCLTLNEGADDDAGHVWAGTQICLPYNPGGSPTSLNSPVTPACSNEIGVPGGGNGQESFGQSRNTCAAEVFDFDPSMYLSNPGIKPNNGRGDKLRCDY